MYTRAMRGAFALVLPFLLLACPPGEGTGGTGGGGQGGAGNEGGGASGGSGGAAGAGGDGAGLPVWPTSCDDPNTNVPEGECDILQQNCPLGETCKVVSLAGMTKPRCVPQSGLKTLGAKCPSGSDDECAAGLVCAIDVCTAFCCPADDEPCGGGKCSLQFQYGNGLTAYMCGFNQACTLFEPDSCPATQDCHVTDAAEGLTTCTPTSQQGVLGEGEVCTYINECPDSAHCYNSRCRYYCALTGPETTNEPGLGGCAPNRVCKPNAQIPVDNVGLCLPP